MGSGSAQLCDKGGLSFALSNFREQEGRVVYDYVVSAKGNALDKGSDGVTRIREGAIIFDGTERTDPTP